MAGYGGSNSRLSSRGGLYAVPADMDRNYTPSQSQYYQPYSGSGNDGNYKRGNEPPVDYEKGQDKDKREYYDTDDSVDLDSEGKEKSIYRLWGRFADKTAMQGCAYIYTAKFWYAKLLWVILLLGAIGGMVYHLYFLSTTYAANPKITKVSLGFSNLPFPAITFCNTNAIRHSRLNETSQEMQTLVSYTEPNRFDPTKHINANGNRRKKRFVDDFLNLDFDNLTDKEDYYDYYGDSGEAPPKDEQAELENSFKELYLEMDRYKRMELGHQIEDMLISCSFDGYKCYAENFTVFNNEDFGNCFTFENPKFMVSKSGPRAGLSIILYLETEEYVEGISQGYGIRLVVHEQKSYAFPADGGIFLSPATEAHLGLKLTNISRIGDPYGKCNDGIAYSKQYGLKYTRMICQSLCKQNEMFKRCGCYDEEDEEMLYSIRRNNLKFCESKTEWRCKEKVNYEYEKKAFSCTCYDPCEERKYTLYPSYRLWPSDQYAVLLQEGVCDKLDAGKCKRIVEQTDPRTLAQNFLKFTIYYEDLNFEKLEEEPEIETSQFVSDVGGAIGLWIGLSLLAIFEVFQFFAELVAFGCHKCCNKDAKKRQQRRKQREKEKARRMQNGGPMVQNQPSNPNWSKDNKHGGFDNVNFAQPTNQNRWGGFGGY